MFEIVNDLCSLGMGGVASFDWFPEVRTLHGEHSGWLQFIHTLPCLVAVFCLITAFVLVVWLTFYGTVKGQTLNAALHKKFHALVHAWVCSTWQASFCMLCVRLCVCLCAWITLVRKVGGSYSELDCLTSALQSSASFALQCMAFFVVSENVTSPVLCMTCCRKRPVSGVSFASTK